MTKTKIIEWLKKYKLIIGLAFLCTILFFIKSSYQEEEIIDQKIKPTPIKTIIQTIPTVTQTKTTLSDPTDGDPNYPLQAYLPYQDQKFVISKYIAPLVLEVQVKNKSEINNLETLVKEWLSKKEFPLGQHKLIWQISE